MPKSDPTLEPYLSLLDEAFERKAWHGPNLRGALRGLSAESASWRPAAGRHNAWELAVHAAYWKYAVRRLLTGERRGAFRFSGSNWFSRPAGDGSERAFRADLEALVEEHRLLRDAVSRLRARELRLRPRGSKYTHARLIQGVAAHDLYHAGQIQLLKRLRSGTARAREG
jgi:uncharacterized damage-inducible protein DinB